MSHTITCNPSDFAPFLYIRKVHPRSIYDFTFENRYIVYHYTRPSQNSVEYVYAYLDKTNRRTSQLFVHKTMLSEKESSLILSALLFSIKFNSNTRYTAYPAV